MMKYFLLLIGAIVVINNSHAQKVVKDEYDKFLKIQRKETSWERFAVRFSDCINQKVKTLDGRLYIELGVHRPSVFRIDEGDKVYILLDNDETVELICSRGDIANYFTVFGVTEWNMVALYPLPEEAKIRLLKNKAVGVRVDMGDTYTEYDRISTKRANKLQKALTLITEK